jgi:hypothetical protein
MITVEFTVDELKIIKFAMEALYSLVNNDDNKLKELARKISEQEKN